MTEEKVIHMVCMGLLPSCSEANGVRSLSIFPIDDKLKTNILLTNTINLLYTKNDVADNHA
jgi:hypothetical protein